MYVGKIKNSKLKIQNSELPAFVNIDTKGVIEVHIPAFKGDLYGQPMTIQFMRFLREERQFKNLEALREQIKADIDSIRHQA